MACGLSGAGGRAGVGGALQGPYPDQALEGAAELTLSLSSLGSVPAVSHGSVPVLACFMIKGD